MIELGSCANCRHETFVLRGETAYSVVLDSAGEVLARTAEDGFDGDVECASCGETHRKVEALPKEAAGFLEGELFGPQ